MPHTATISPSIIETLYEDALVLADEARAAFDLGESVGGLGEDASMMRMAMSCEALRTTTRMMHAIAWLLNQKAYFSGEMTEFQLRHHGRLPPAQAAPEAAQMRLLPHYVADLVERSVAFYARVERLDKAWRASFALQPAAVHRLRERLGCAFAG
ncbi:hypothetical protein AAW01_12370 [Aurantiacibacter gangjinensis]|uniref:Uncharacterized protein n=2 Tax=Aurantiacibacter gangjinensis TaxID=502682 RepID=A0A0G9MKI5_9SPHN|nr:hypothetical protein AAW01_12370 [Aurantiacibacter gangjinensis]